MRLVRLAERAVTLVIEKAAPVQWFRSRRTNKQPSAREVVEQAPYLSWKVALLRQQASDFTCDVIGAQCAVAVIPHEGAEGVQYMTSVGVRIK